MEIEEWWALDLLIHLKLSVQDEWLSIETNWILVKMYINSLKSLA